MVLISSYQAPKVEIGRVIRRTESTDPNSTNFSGKEKNEIEREVLKF